MGCRQHTLLKDIQIYRLQAFGTFLDILGQEGFHVIVFSVP